MTNYIIRRLLLIIPTMFGIMATNFLILQVLPGGPVEQIIAKLSGNNTLIAIQEHNENAEGLNLQSQDEQLKERLRKQFGLDKPLLEQFGTMIYRYIRLDFGDSFFQGRPVVDMIIEKLPVSISLGIWTILITYLISIPLGIRKAVRDGSQFDAWSSTAIIIGSSIPAFIFALLMIVFFSGGRFFNWFPLRGLVSSDFDTLTWWQQIGDYGWHLFLPILSISIGGFATLTLLTKNSFLEHINKEYVTMIRAKGATENRILYGHVFRNAMLIVIAAFPSAFISLFFTSSLLIEVIFSLDGLGLLGYKAVLQRDYPIVMGSLFVFSFLGLILGVITDLVYTLIDPRINFDKN